MKRLFFITSPNWEEFEAEWVKHKHQWWQSSTDLEGMYWKDNEIEVYAFKARPFRLDKKWDYGKITRRINSLLTANNDDECGIYLHDGKGPLKELKDEINSESIHCVDYSSGGTFDFNSIKQIIKNPCSDSFQALWQGVEQQKKEQRFLAAQKLRYEMLPFFVAFRWLTEAGIDHGGTYENLRYQICKIKKSNWLNDFKKCLALDSNSRTIIYDKITYLQTAVKGKKNEIEITEYDNNLNQLSMTIETNIQAILA